MYRTLPYFLVLVVVVMLVLSGPKKKAANVGTPVLTPTATATPPIEFLCYPTTVQETDKEAYICFVSPDKHMP